METAGRREQGRGLERLRGRAGTLPAWALLGAVWLAAILVINPLGEFLVNDDWSFVRALEALLYEGRIIPTGWGHGGPSLLTHLLWGGLFTSLFGFSLTVLRLSTLSAGVAASLVLVLLLKRSGARDRVWLLSGLILILNPLFLPLCFSYMTDITFTLWLVLALLLLGEAFERSSTAFLAAGLAASLAAILTRQIGLCLPLGLALTALLRPQGRSLGRARVLVLILVLNILPWLAWELVLSRTGSTPLTHHKVILRLADLFTGQDLGRGLGLVASRLFFAGLGYLAFFLSPIILPLLAGGLRTRPLKAAAGVYPLLCLALEVLLLSGLVSLPVFLHRNVIYNLGIGPLLFKDTYILGFNRTLALGPAGFYPLVMIALPCLAWLLLRAASFARRLIKGQPVSPVGAVAFLGGAAYLAAITLTGLHDRYLIPLLPLALVWLGTDQSLWAGPLRRPGGWPRAGSVLGGLVLAGLGFFSLAGSHDLIATRRAAAQAHDYVVRELKVDPCRFDGGFEYNGFHCYRPGFRPRPGLSWWWVESETYLLALGPLPGYSVVKSFAVGRCLGPDGAVFVLRPPGP